MRVYYRFLQGLARAPTRKARYGLAIIVSGLTLLIGLLLDQAFGGSPPIILFIIPVALFLAIRWLVSWLIETTHAARRRAEAEARAAKRWGE